jgi:hypothetical protein
MRLMNEYGYPMSERRRGLGLEGWSQESSKDEVMKRVDQLIAARETNGNAILSIMSAYNITIKDLTDIGSTPRLWRYSLPNSSRQPRTPTLDQADYDWYLY